MAKTWKRYATLLLAVMMVMVALAGCKPTGTGDDSSDVTTGGSDKPVVPQGPFTYRTYTSTMPGNWNELTYEDNNDTQILNYIVSPFIEYDYKFENGKKYNDDGSINVDCIVEAGFDVNIPQLPSWRM